MSHGGRRLVLVPVAAYDLRATIALEQSLTLPACERRAIHVSADCDAECELGVAWMASGLEFPLEIVDDDGRGTALTIGRLVERELANGFDEVVVVLGRLELRRRVHRLLHDRSADAIASVVDLIPSARARMITVATT